MGEKKVEVVCGGQGRMRWERSWRRYMVEKERGGEVGRDVLVIRMIGWS